MRHFITLLLILLLSGCAHPYDSLKPESLDRRPPAECPEIEGWFTAMGKKYRSSRIEIVEQDLVVLLFGMGVLLHGDEWPPVPDKAPASEEEAYYLNEEAFKKYEAATYNFLKYEHDKTTPVYLKITPGGIALRLKDKEGRERAFRFAFGEDKMYGHVRRELTSQYCLQDKLVLRSHRSFVGEWSENTYIDTIFRFDEEGLTVTLYSRYRREWDFLFLIPLSTSRNGKAVFFFPAVHDKRAMP